MSVSINLHALRPNAAVQKDIISKSIYGINTSITGEYVYYLSFCESNGIFGISTNQRLRYCHISNANYIEDITNVFNPSSTISSLLEEDQHRQENTAGGIFRREPDVFENNKTRNPIGGILQIDENRLSVVLLSDLQTCMSRAGPILFGSQSNVGDEKFLKFQSTEDIIKVQSNSKLFAILYFIIIFLIQIISLVNFS